MLQEIIDIIKTNKQIKVIAIDGRCGSGKTTISKALQKEFNCNLIHLDDFFLRPSQKTPKRLNEVGGNIDYERFINEVLSNLEKKEFSYKPYNCTKLDFDNEIKVINNKLLIIEGTYSMHPKFINYYDFKIFVTLDQKLQIERLKNRNPLLLDRFINEWIPKEEAYFDKFETLKSADKVITSRIN